jgi:uncharacterized protein YndB with AHSA1/START domain
MAKVKFTAPEGKTEVFISCLIDAPRKTVFSIFTNPEKIPDWWGPAYLTTRVELQELRFGGRWRYVQQDPDGNVYGFHGVYHAVVPDEHLVDTFEFEGTPGHVLLEFIDFSDEGSQTRIEEHVLYESVADRDAMIAEGMESGLTEGFQRLELLAQK